MTTSTALRPSIVVLIAAVVFAACGSAAAPATAGPGASAAVSPAPSSSASPDGETPVGTDLPPGGGGGGNQGGRIVVPRPGQLDVRAIPAERLSATVDGHRVVVTVTFTSGVEPCHVLDTIVVERGTGSFVITLREGHGPGDQACIEIAETKRALVDLGDLDPGTYTISDATGGAPAIEVVVS